MSKNDFLDNEAKYLEFTWTIMERHYQSKETFVNQYQALSTAEVKNQFLQLASYYKFLVREFNYEHPEGFDVDFAAQTYKFIGLIALIESLYTTEDYKDFYEWLITHDPADTYPIKDKSDLKKLFEEYCVQHGSTRKIVRYFQGLDKSAQQYITNAVIKLVNVEGAGELDEEREPIEKLAKLLFQIRSDFVHHGRLVLEFSDSTVISKRDKSVCYYNIELEELEKIFVTELLKHYNFTPEREVI